MALVQIVCGEVRRVLKSAPDNCVQMCVTSPPYWGLRAYGTNPQIWGGDPDCDHFWGEWEEQHQIREASCHGKSRTTDRFYGAPSRRFQGNHEKHTAGSYCQSCGAWLGELGAEPTPEQYVQNLVEVFREVRRILREDGILFLNLGDSYARSAAKGQHKAGDSGKQAYIYDRGNGRASATADLTACGMEEKDLVGIPWQTALALRADGWYLRSEIIWEKPNCLPESVRDRPTRSHEQIFLLTKSPRYYYDMEAIREAFQTDPKENYPKRARVTGRGDQTSSNASTSGAQQDKSGGYPPSGNGRNARTVWRFTTQPFNAKKLGFQDVEHFATFPEELAERCILAGS